MFNFLFHREKFLPNLKNTNQQHRNDGTIICEMWLESKWTKTEDVWKVMNWSGPKGPKTSWDGNGTKWAVGTGHNHSTHQDKKKMIYGDTIISLSFATIPRLISFPWIELFHTHLTQIPLCKEIHPMERKKRKWSLVMYVL